MKAYIGCKVIKAQRCSKESFDYQKAHNFDGSLPNDNNDSVYTPGYIVEYSNPDGSIYRSWSPKEVFERAYREVSEDEKRLINN